MDKNNNKMAYLLDKCYSLKVGLKNPKAVNHRIPDKSEIRSFFPTSDSGEAQDIHSPLSMTEVIRFHRIWLMLNAKVLAYLVT